MVAWVGFRQEELLYDRAARHAGETKYPLRKMLRFAGDAIFSFSFVPLRLATLFGLLVSGVSFGYAIYSVLAKIFDWDVVHGWASLMVAVLFLGGVQLVSLGILGEYLGRVYDEVKARPLYLAQEVRRGRQRVDEQSRTAAGS
jgi:dolichol-phosphate mannosyltransferase